MTSQTEIDRILGGWLNEGSERAPEGRLRAALQEVATTPQQRVLHPRWFGRRIGATGHHGLAYAMVGAVLVAMLAMGLSIEAGLLHLPMPSVGPHPPPSPMETDVRASQESMVVGDPRTDGTYRLTIPANWSEVPPRVPGVRVFRNDGVNSRIVLRIAFESPDGILNLCLDRCASFTGIDSLDQLSAALDSRSLGFDTPFGPLMPMQGVKIVRGETFLHGEPANTTRPDGTGLDGRGPGELYEHVYAIHDGRAVVLSFDYGLVSEHQVLDIIPSFRFVDPISSEELGLELYSNGNDGYEVLIPAVWADDPAELVYDSGSHAVTFGSGRGAGTRGSPALTITMGQPNGTISLCGSCAATVVTTLDNLQELVVSNPTAMDLPPEKQVAINLGGEPGRSERAQISNSCLGCPGAYYHVFTIHDGRPVVLAFDYWTVRFESMVVTPGNEVPFTGQMLDAILESFRFTDG